MNHKGYNQLGFNVSVSSYLQIGYAKHDEKLSVIYQFIMWPENKDSLFYPLYFDLEQ